MFSIGPFHHSAGQPAGFFDSLFPLEPLPADAVRASATAPVAAPAKARMGLGRQALTMVLLVALTLGVNSAAGLWALSSHAGHSGPSVQVASAQAPS